MKSAAVQNARESDVKESEIVEEQKADNVTNVNMSYMSPFAHQSPDESPDESSDQTNDGMIMQPLQQEQKDEVGDDESDNATQYVMAETQQRFVTRQIRLIEQDYHIDQAIARPCSSFGTSYLCWKHPSNFEKRNPDWKPVLKRVRIINKTSMSLKTDLKETQNILNRIAREVGVLSIISHPSIVKLVDVYESRHKTHLIMDYFSGNELFYHIAESDDGYSERDAAGIIYQLLNGLNYLHDKGIAHLNIEPENLIFTKKAGLKIKIVDFGCACVVPRFSKLLGKLDPNIYQAPEVLKGKYSHSADIWSLGIVLFAMMFGYPPFYHNEEDGNGDEVAMVTEKICDVGFTPHVEAGYGAWFPQDIPISPSLQELISNMLTSDTTKRWTAKECLDSEWLREQLSIESMPMILKGGLTTFDSHRKFRAGICAILLSAEPTHEISMYDQSQIEQVFSRFDSNNTGQISREEFIDGMKNVYKSDLKKVQLVEMFENLDIDGTEYLTIDVFIIIAVYYKLVSEDERLYNLFKQLDSNDDGRITKSNVSSVLIRNKTAFSKRAQEFLENDFSESTMVNLEEFLRLMHPGFEQNMEFEEWEMQHIISCQNISHNYNFHISLSTFIPLARSMINIDQKMGYDSNKRFFEFETQPNKEQGINITNLSWDDKLAVLVESEQTAQNRTEVLRSIAEHFDDDESESKNEELEDFKSKFILLESRFECQQKSNNNSNGNSNSNNDMIELTNAKYSSHKFVTKDDLVYVTCINLTTKQISYDRHQYMQTEYLYFTDDRFVSLNNLRPKCNNCNTLNKSNLVKIQYHGEKGFRRCNECVKKYLACYHCYPCGRSLCTSCCHLQICHRYSHTKPTDEMTMVSDLSQFSRVSALSKPYIIKNALIVILGIGEYCGNMNNLPGVSKDYKNIINVFTKTWNYKVFYWVDKDSKDDDDDADDANSTGSNNNSNINYNYTPIYTNDTEMIENNLNFKLQWNGDEIDDFLEESRTKLVQNRHDGLIFIITSHGDSGRVIIDSDGENYELDALYSMFTPDARALLSTEEAESDSNHLLQIPKIFCVDSCRGNRKAKVTQIKFEGIKNKPKLVKVYKSSKNVQNIKNTKNIKNIKNVKNVKEVQVTTVKTSEKVKSQPQPQKDSNNKSSGSEKEKQKQTVEVFGLKAVSKEASNTMAAQDANFCKLYANVEGYSVADGSDKGGMLLRNIVKVFRDVKFVSKNDWAKMMVKIREYTKRDASLVGLFNFTQIVENESTLEKTVEFVKNTNIMMKSSNYLTISNIANMNMGINGNFGAIYESEEENDDQGVDDIDNDQSDDGISEEDQMEMSLIIANLSSTDEIAVLIDQEETAEDRTQLMSMLTANNDNFKEKDELFKMNGFKFLLPNKQSGKIVKVWESIYLTVINKSKNELICQNDKHSDNYLYFIDDNMHRLQHMKPQCDNNHKLIAKTIHEKFQCDECKKNSVGKCYFCHQCDHSICQHCTNYIICQKFHVDQQQK